MVVLSSVGIRKLIAVINNIKNMKYKYLENTAKKTILYAKNNKIPVLMTIDGFKTDKEALHLRDMLWFAKESEVEIMFIV